MDILTFFQPLLDKFQEMLSNHCQQKVWLTRDELKAHLKIKSDSTIDKMQQEGLPYIKHRPNLYRLDLVEKWLESRMINL